MAARLPRPSGDDPLRLREACRYAMLGGGKRLRPLVLLAACEAVGGKRDEAVLAAACALEAVHGYSLVHDDLPAMDNDDLRRGKPTVHCAFGEACAILVGDALLTLAFGWLAAAGRQSSRAATFLRASEILAERAGLAGMVLGQARDLATQGRELDLAAVELLAGEKTGGLFRAAALIGGLCGGGTEADLAALDRYGAAFGVMFQHADDFADASHPELRAEARARMEALDDVARAQAARFGARGVMLDALSAKLAGR